MRPLRATPPRWFLPTGNAARTCQVVPPLRLNCQWFVVVASPREGFEPPKKCRNPSSATSAPPPRPAGSGGIEVYVFVSVSYFHTAVVEKFCPVPSGWTGYPPAM